MFSRSLLAPTLLDALLPSPLLPESFTADADADAKTKITTLPPKSQLLSLHGQLKMILYYTGCFIASVTFDTPLIS